MCEASATEVRAVGNLKPAAEGHVLSFMHINYYDLPPCCLH